MDEEDGVVKELGEITRCYSLRYERRSKHPPERLWRAITDPGELSRWMSYPARVELRIGGDYFVDFSRRSPEEPRRRDRADRARAPARLRVGHVRGRVDARAERERQPLHLRAPRHDAPRHP